MNIARLFDDTIPKALLAHPKEARAVDRVFDLAVHGVGTWRLDCRASVPSCERQPLDRAVSDVCIGCSANDFETLIADPSNNAMKLYFSGRLVIDGDIESALKLAKVFALVEDGLA
jgi:predicted lipid carrier protein YhbT